MMTPAQLVLPDVLDLQAAEPLRVQLLGLRGQAVTLDASGVERLGGLCLQVLLSAQRSWAADGQPLSIAPMSDAFAEQWKNFGAEQAASEWGEVA